MTDAHDLLLRAALLYSNEAGLSVIPTRNDKAPAVPWKVYQQRIPTEKEIRGWFPRYTRLGIVCGKVSGNLELIDFDSQPGRDIVFIFQNWRQLIEEQVPGLFERLLISRSPSGGLHVVYRCPDTQIPGNQKLAQIKTGQEILTLIETRGEGGQFLAYPSPGYRLMANNFGIIPVVTVHERKLMLEAARSFNEFVEPSRIVHGPHGSKTRGNNGLTPGDDYCQRADLPALLVKHGWQPIRGDGTHEYYRRPGKERGTHSASIIDGKTFYVFSSNAHPFEADRGYSSFGVYALLEHAGDFAVAARELARQGYGERRERPRREASCPSSEWIGKVKWPRLISNYLELTAKFSESPAEFHLVAILYAIACITRRNRYLAQGFHRFYPNLYVVAVAPSSLFKKSAVEGFRDLLKRLEIFHLIYLGQVGSPEGLFRGLQENRGSGALYYPELGVLLAQSSGRQYMSGILELLCELYDCPDYIKKPLSNQTREARDVYLNIMAATQLHSLSSHTKEGDLLTGFLPRFVVAYSEELRPHLVRRPEPDPTLLNQIVSDLNEIRWATEQPVRMDMAEEAWQRFEAWGHERHKEALAAPPQIQPMYGRLETHALKFSMLLALAANPTLREIPPSCVEAAIGCAEYVLASYRKLVLEELTFTGDERKLKRVADVFKAKGRASRKELTIATRMKAKDLNECIQMLTIMGQIKFDKGPKGGDGWLWKG